MEAQCFKIALEIPDGPGALKGLVLVSVFSTLLVVNAGKSEDGDLGGLCLRNWCSLTAECRSGGKKADARHCDFSALVDAVVPSDFLRLGILCLP